MPASRALLDFKGLLLFIPALFPLLPLHLASGLLVAWAILSLVYFIAFPKQRIAFPIQMLLPIAMFLLFIIALPFAKDHANQLSYVERNLAWFVIPISFWMVGITESKHWIKIIFYFVCAYSLLMMFAHSITLLEFRSLKDIPVTSLTYLYRTYFENHSGLHPAYATLFSALSIVYCVYSILAEIGLTVIKKSLILIVALLHLSSTIVLASRMALVATIIATIVLVFSNRTYIKQGIAIITLFLIVGAYFTINTPFISSRMKEVSSEALQMPTQQTGNTLSIRTGIYTCVFTLLKEHWLLGLTPGDLQVNLNNCYGNINANDLKKEEYNTHNEYFNKWLSFGLIGVCLLIAILIIPFIMAIKGKFILFACFLLMMGIVLFSENMFSRQYGLFFFLLIYSPALLIISSENIKQNISN